MRQALELSNRYDPTDRFCDLKISRIAIFAIIPFLLIACGGSSENLTKRKELEDRVSLQENLEPLVGTYSGFIDNRPDGSDAFPIELNIFLVEEESGVNEEGELQFRPSLRARYKRLDLLSEGLGERTLRLRFYREQSEITGTTASSSTQSAGISDAQYMSFSGSLTSDELDLEFRDHRGIMGYAQLERD